MFFVHSGKTKFHYLFLDAHQAPIGSLDFPNGLTFARNRAISKAVSQKLQGHVSIKFQEDACHLEYERYDNQIRYFLLSQPHEAPLAVADSIKKGWSIVYNEKEYTLKKMHFLSFRFSLFQADALRGTLYENTGFSVIRRKFVVDLPEDLPLPVQGLIFYLATSQFFS